MNKETNKTLTLAGILWILLIIPFLITGRLVFFPYYFILPISIIYFLLWLIPLKFPKVKPLFVSSTIGIIISLFFVPFVFLVYWLLFVKDVYNPDALIWAGLPFILIPSLIIIIISSIIIGIILTIRKKNLK